MQKEQRRRECIGYILILVVLSVAVYYDSRSFKIPNWLSYTSWGVGIIYSFVVAGLKGLFFSLVWILIPIAILFLLFCFGYLGAGDIKLYSFIGSIIFSGVIKVIIISMSLCGIYALFLIVKKLVSGKLRNGFTTTHFSVFILAGTAIYIGGVLYGI